MSEFAVRRALLTVYDKASLADFAAGLASLGVELLATGGTRRFLCSCGIEAKEVSEATGYPEILGGRVKTLHPRIQGGILYRRGDPSDEEEIRRFDLKPIDLVVVDLYPFAEFVKRPGASVEEITEQIDVGGPTLIRAAAKNFKHVGVVVDPADYGRVLAELRESRCSLSHQTRQELMRKAFEKTAEYDSVISSYFGPADTEGFPSRLRLDCIKVSDLRYGENPHQKAAIYRVSSSPFCLAGMRQMAGEKELSYNNILDCDAALSLMWEIKEDVATLIIKHTNPCGGAIGKTLLESYAKALQTDPISAFGGVYAFSRRVDLETAEAMVGQFIEIIIAPGYDSNALELLSRKKNRRILDMGDLVGSKHVFPQRTFRSTLGGMLYQDYDQILLRKEQVTYPTRRRTTEEEERALLFGWKFVKHAKSNAIVLSTESQLIGVGAGQMSRVDSCRIAIEKAKRSGLQVEGTVLASDAFLPFRDSIDLVGKEGVTAVIQPGGSIRDGEVIQAADEYDMAMMLTGVRHFKH